ncbi:MAG: hypothetical protein VKK04_17595 [Synechococcales bacterium]|nr:hypothetical protein [Synechococcales bacterium]
MVSRISSSRNSSTFPQPLDRTALILMAVLAIIIAGLLMGGDRTLPRVRDFSWQGKQVGAEDVAFTLTFNRPMDHKSVEDNLQVEVLIPDRERQPVPGKVSWAGRRMAYTLTEPAPYGYEFELNLDQARDRFTEAGPDAPTIEPFTGSFRTRDSAFLYLGVSGEEEGRLVLHNFTRKEKRLLTPETLVVMNYEPYPEGDRVLFSATDRVSQEQGLLNQQLYAVSTGIQVESPALLPGDRSLNKITPSPVKELPPEGEVQLILDSTDYQNLKFDLSPDGQTIVAYRVNRQNPADFGLWVVRADEPPHPLDTEPGGDFLITPDSQAIAYLQGQGLSLLPLSNDDITADPLEFLPQYGMVLGFSRNGSGAAMVQFNPDPATPTQSLFLVTNQGTEKELLEIQGSILDAQFDPMGNVLYCLVTEVVPGDFYVEQPYLVAIDLQTAERTDLLILPIQPNIHMSLAPDGLGILFDQVMSTPDDTSEPGLLRGNDGKPIGMSKLWFLPILRDEDGQLIQTDPDELPMAGLQPQWLP